MSERELLNQLMLALSNAGHRVFRNQSGRGWLGQSQRFSRRQRITVEPGDVLVRNARVVRSGLTPGASDLIGWTSDGRFLAIEGKTAHARLTDEQANFIRQARSAGGVAMEARSLGDLGGLLDGQA